jgi:hypothetical protein
VAHLAKKASGHLVYTSAKHLATDCATAGCSDWYAKCGAVLFAYLTVSGLSGSCQGFPPFIPNTVCSHLNGKVINVYNIYNYGLCGPSGYSLDGLGGLETFTIDGTSVTYKSCLYCIGNVYWLAVSISNMLCAQVFNGEVTSMVTAKDICIINGSGSIPRVSCFGYVAPGCCTGDPLSFTIDSAID